MTVCIPPVDKGEQTEKKNHLLFADRLGFSVHASGHSIECLGQTVEFRHYRCMARFLALWIR